MYLEKLESNKSFIHFLRTRRFGKSLFTSMLEAYYDIDTKDEFEVLFKGTYIHEHPTKERNSYYILRFDFSVLNTSNAAILEEEIHNRIFQTCKEFLSKYNINMQIDFGSSAASCISAFLSGIKANLNASIYIIIDEYDHFANELLSFKFNDFHNVVSKNSYVRKFYTLCTRWCEVLKTGTVDSTIGRIFITGVSPITLDSMTSGYNISTNLSLDPRFNEMMGLALPARRVY